MSRLNSFVLARAAIWFIPLLWSVNYFVARKAPGVIAPYTLTTIRWSVAGVILSLMSYAELRQQRRYILSALPQFVVLGFCGMVVCGAWVYLGATSTTAINIALIYSAAPVLIAIGSVRWLQERMRPVQILGVVIALGGVVHVIVKGQWRTLGNVQFVVGDVWIVAATLAWAAYSLLQKLWGCPLSGNARLAVTSWAAMPILLAGTGWELLQPDTPVLTAYSVSLGITAAIFPGVLAYLIYSWTQQVLGASKVAMTFYLGPLYGAMIAWLLLNEQLGWFHLQAAFLILPGVFLVSQTRKVETK